MDHTGWVYVPTVCQEGARCQLHICFHGCEQGYSFVQGAFIKHNQLNNYAEANNLIVLYPQAIATPVLNPDGCWDWWAYTGEQYATKYGSQIDAVHRMMRALI
jgi:poly(3-hydroxybutyrate) depolymerase